jgi:PAS domain S-box-containing protein
MVDMMQTAPNSMTDADTRKNLQLVAKELSPEELGLIEACGIGFYIIERGVFSYVNSHLAELMGYEEALQLIGKSLWSIVHPDDAAKVRLKVEKAYNDVYWTGVPHKNITYDVIRRDGLRMLVEDSVSLIRDAEGRVNGFRTVNRDISNRGAAEKRLAEHHVRLEAIFRSVKDAIITVDPALRVIEANLAAETVGKNGPNLRQLSAQKRDRILAVLKQMDGNKSKAAHFLGISRQTLYRRLSE